MTTTQSAYSAKMAARFATFDRDRDGVVDVADFEAMARAITVSCGRDPESPEGIRLLDGARTFFSGLLEVADTDGDGGITESEFVDAAQVRLRHNPEGFELIARPWAEAVVDVADVDGDGVVDLVEWARVLRAMGATQRGAEEQAARIDIDGDGRVSVDEVLASAVAFYTADDADDAGHVFDQA